MNFTESDVSKINYPILIITQLTDMTLTINEIQGLETEMLEEVAQICDTFRINYYLGYGSVLGGVRHNAPIPWDLDADILIPENEFELFINTVKANMSDKFYIDYHDNTHYPFLFPRIGLKGYSTYILHVDIFRLVGIFSLSNQQQEYRNKSMFYQDLFLYKKTTKKYFHKNLTRKQRILYFITRLLLLPISDKYIINKFNEHCSKLPYEKALYVDNPNGCHGMLEVIPKSYLGKGVSVDYSGIKLKIPEKFENYLRHYYGNYMNLPPENERTIENFYNISKNV